MKNKYVKWGVLLACAIVISGFFLYQHEFSLSIARIGNWNILPYNNVDLESNTFPATISSQAGGLYFTPATASEATYGTLELLIPPYENLELMIYADAPFVYKLEELSLVSCSSNLMGDNEFRTYIMEQIPTLDQALADKDHLKAAYLLLHWSARMSDLGSNIPATALIQSVSNLSAAEIFANIWEKDVGGGSCEAFAVFYAKVLKVFGIESFSVDAGLDSTFYITHVTTIVAIPAQDKWKFYIFDPTAAGTFIDSQDNYVDLETMLNGYNSDTKRLAANYWVVAEECFPRDVTWFNDAGLLDTVEKDTPYCFDQLLSAWGRLAKEKGSIWADSFDGYLAKQNSNIIIDMFLNEIYRVGPALDAKSRQAFLHLLREHNSTLPKD